MIFNNSYRLQVARKKFALILFQMLCALGVLLVTWDLSKLLYKGYENDTAL
jgi:hypothetical protein